jgi:hypothetical protein
MLTSVYKFAITSIVDRWCAARHLSGEAGSDRAKVSPVQPGWKGELLFTPIQHAG